MMMMIPEAQPSLFTVEVQARRLIAHIFRGSPGNQEPFISSLPLPALIVTLLNIMELARLLLSTVEVLGQLRTRLTSLQKLQASQALSSSLPLPPAPLLVLKMMIMMK
jgi:hypothetical protein